MSAPQKAAKAATTTVNNMSLIRKALLKYPQLDSVKDSSRTGQRNLIELLMRFPKNGKGMRVYRKSWPENCYWQIWSTHMTSEKTARIYGVKYWNGKLISQSIDKINGANKRGIWQYDITSLEDKELKKYAADVETGTIKKEWLPSAHRREQWAKKRAEAAE